MKVLHLSAGNRWTGAAAPAFAEAEALRGAGVEAHYAYVGGYKLEQRIGSLPWTHPIIEKRQNPASFLRSVDALARLVEGAGIDIIHAHLSWDHWLARSVARRTGAALARTFHAQRALRRDPFTRALVARTEHLFVVNETFLTARLVRDRDPRFTPPPVDSALFTADGDDARANYGVDAAAPLLCVIGKLAPDRGFEAALDTFKHLLDEAPEARLMIIGHGPHQPVLEAYADGLRISHAVIWAGYHEVDLPQHFRSADVMLFTAKGSDEGHRAILEAMACGTAVAALPLAGVTALFPNEHAEFVASSTEPADLAAVALNLLTRRSPLFRAHCVAMMAPFGYGPAAQRLLAAYGLARHDSSS